MWIDLVPYVKSRTSAPPHDRPRFRSSKLHISEVKWHSSDSNLTASVSATILWNQFENYTLKINSLWPSDTIWPHRSWSTLAQVMACCLMAPSYYLNQCWLIIITDQWQGQLHQRYSSHQSRKSASICLNKNAFKSPMGQWVLIPHFSGHDEIRDSYINSNISCKFGRRHVFCLTCYGHTLFGSWVTIG